MKPEHPLIAALNRKRAPEAPMDLPSMPRLFDVTAKDVPAVLNMRPGDPIHLELEGKIKSLHDGGRATIEVSSVSSETDDAKEPPIYVRTQDSPSPGAV
jgi:hypothetical protein